MDDDPRDRVCGVRGRPSVDIAETWCGTVGSLGETWTTHPALVTCAQCQQRMGADTSEDITQPLNTGSLLAGDEGAGK